MACVSYKVAHGCLLEGESIAQHLFGSTTAGIGLFIKKGREGIPHSTWPQASLSRYAKDLRPVSGNGSLYWAVYIFIYLHANSGSCPLVSRFHMSKKTGLKA